MKRLTVVFAVTFSVVVVGAFRAGALSLKTDEPPQTPDKICKCAGDDSISKGGIRTFDEFKEKYGADFSNPAELQLAWKVYQAVNRCDSTVVLGRLSDTGSFESKPGYCVLRTLEGWTMRVNRAFVQAATDRGARIQLVSDAPLEAMSGKTGSDVDINKIGEGDREGLWIVIYNNEIQWVLQSGRYKLALDESKKITPENPAFFEPADVKATATATVSTGKSGTLQLVEIKPDPPCETWKDLYTTCDPKTGTITAKANWGSAMYQWTPPPDRIGPEGCTVTLNASEQTPPSAPIATGLNIRSGLEVEPSGATLAIGAPKQPLSGSTTVRLKAPKNPAGDYYVSIGVYWGPGFTYHYRGNP